MPPASTDIRSETITAHAFPATRWSVVVRSEGEGESAQMALETLCRSYWRPVYSFLRRLGHCPHDAEDLTQSFFSQLLAKRAFSRAEPARGRLRTFLLTDLKLFLSNERRSAERLKRGGGATPVPLDAEDCEAGLERELSHATTPDLLFDRTWVLALLQRVFDELQESYRMEGREAIFDELKFCVVDGADPEEPYAAIADRLGMTEGTLRVNVHRLRARYRELLMREVADTLESPAKVADELRHLLGTVTRAMNV